MGVDFGVDDEGTDMMYYELYNLIAKLSVWLGKAETYLIVEAMRLMVDIVPFGTLGRGRDFLWPVASSIFIGAYPG
jgi:hypothetical protein